MAKHDECFWAHFFIITGQSAQQHPQNVSAPAIDLLVAFSKSLLIGRIVLQNNTKGVQRHRNHTGIGVAQQFLQLLYQFIQFLRIQIQRNLSQIIRDIFGKFVFPDFQSLGQLDCQLIALLRCEQRCDIYQTLPCSVAHTDPLAHFQNVGQMVGYLQKRNGLMLGHIQKKIDVGHFQHPRCRHFLIFQK